MAAKKRSSKSSKKQVAMAPRKGKTGCLKANGRLKKGFKYGKGKNKGMCVRAASK
jgi:hypothetical protein